MPEWRTERLRVDDLTGGVLMGNSPDTARLFRAWVAALGARGVGWIDPRHPEDRRRLHAVSEHLGMMASIETDPTRRRLLVRLRNAFRPDAVGAFGFVSAGLATLTLSLTEVFAGEPGYQICSDRAFCASVATALPEPDRSLAAALANCYVSA